HTARLGRDFGSGVQRALALDKHDVALFFGDGIVANTFGHYKGFAFLEFDCASLHFDAQLALEDVEQFVLVVVAVPSERSVNLGYLDIRVIELGHHAWRPQLCETGRDCPWRDSA